MEFVIFQMSVWPHSYPDIPLDAFKLKWAQSGKVIKSKVELIRTKCCQGDVWNFFTSENINAATWGVRLVYILTYLFLQVSNQYAGSQQVISF